MELKAEASKQSIYSLLPTSDSRARFNILLKKFIARPRALAIFLSAIVLDQYILLQPSRMHLHPTFAMCLQ